MLKTGRTFIAASCLVSLLTAGCTCSLKNCLSRNSAPLPPDITGRDGAVMVLIPEGEFEMGSREKEGYRDEEPRRRVYLDACYMDRYPVTVKLYRQFCAAAGKDMPSAPPWGWIDSHPMVMVTREDGVEYAEYYGKRLPTEAEWEKACRAGSSALYHFGDRESDLGKYAWYSNNSDGSTRPVGEKAPNAFGLHDMLGNVWEWCSDWYGEDYYKNSPYRNPGGPVTGNFRVIRGGAWPVNAGFCRCSNRYRVNPEGKNMFIGFRCVVPVNRQFLQKSR